MPVGARLPLFFGKKAAKLRVSEIENGFQRTEIRGDRDDRMGILGEQRVFRFDVSINIGATEPVDRLLRIADEE